MLFLPAGTYALIERSMPIACVDFIPIRRTANGATELGLIRRVSPFGRVWCHLGGRIGRNETIRAALQRHAVDTLGVALDLPDDPQPHYVYQWFLPDERPMDAGNLTYGDDPRKHAIGLSYLARALGEPTPRNEALEFRWFPSDALPEPMWPGCTALISKLNPGSC